MVRKQGNTGRINAFFFWMSTKRAHPSKKDVEHGLKLCGYRIEIDLKSVVGVPRLQCAF